MGGKTMDQFLARQKAKNKKSVRTETDLNKKLDTDQKNDDQ